MPTWSLVLLVMIPVLWLAFCILKAQFGLVCGRACSATIVLTDAVAILWLAAQGHQVLNSAQFGFACLVLFTVNVGLSVGWLSGYLKHLRRREKDASEASS